MTRWRDAEVNLRTGLLRILRRAGLKPWPRLYQNLRSSRETELAETFPIHVVAEWLGNSPEKALGHYTQVTEEHYREAVQNPVQQGAERARTRPQGGEGDRPDGEAVRELAACRKTLHDNQMTPTGFEPVSQP